MATSVFNKFSIATTGAAFILLEAISMAPAKATTFTKVDYSGTINGSVSTPLSTQPFLVPVSESSIIDNLSDRVSDAGDSELTIDNPFSYLKAFTDLLKPYTASLSSFEGAGSVFQGGTFLSNFNFSYDKPTDILTVKDYDVAGIQPCLSGTCQVSGKGSFAGTVSSGVVVLPASGILNFDLTQTATPLSDASVAAQQTTSLSGVSSSRSVPEPSAVLGFIGLGGLFAAQRKLQKRA